MSTEKVYCRIRDGEVVDYPVYESYIRNRGHVVSMYVPVAYADKPEVDAYHWLEENLTIAGDVVRCTYTVRRHDLQTILDIIHKVDERELGGLDEVVPVAISEVEPVAIGYVSEGTRSLVGKMLDTWAQERNYDSIVSAASYVTSSNAKFSQEGQRAVELRDQCWEVIYGYLEQVMTGVQPVPVSVEDITGMLPELTWDN